MNEFAWSCVGALTAFVIVVLWFRVDVLRRLRFTGQLSASPAPRVGDDLAAKVEGLTKERDDLRKGFDDLRDALEERKTQP